MRRGNGALKDEGWRSQERKLTLGPACPRRSACRVCSAHATPTATLFPLNGGGTFPSVTVFTSAGMAFFSSSSMRHGTDTVATSPWRLGIVPLLRHRNIHTEFFTHHPLDHRFQLCCASQTLVFRRGADATSSFAWQLLPLIDCGPYRECKSHCTALGIFVHHHGILGDPNPIHSALGVCLICSRVFGKLVVVGSQRFGRDIMTKHRFLGTNNAPTHHCAQQNMRMHLHRVASLTSLSAASELHRHLRKQELSVPRATCNRKRQMILNSTLALMNLPEYAKTTTKWYVASQASLVALVEDTVPFRRHKRHKPILGLIRIPLRHSPSG